MEPTDTETSDAPETVDTATPIDETEADVAPVDGVSEPAAEEAEAPAEEPAEKKERRPPSNIEGDLKDVCDGIITGTITLPEGKTATPHFLANAIQEKRGDDVPVSTGAVTAAMKRWVEYGYITVIDKPYAFDDYTDDGRNLGLAALKQRRREDRAAERAAAKADKKAAAKAEAPDPEPEPEAPAAPEPQSEDAVPF